MVVLEIVLIMIMIIFIMMQFIIMHIEKQKMNGDKPSKVHL